MNEAWILSDNATQSQPGPSASRTTSGEPRYPGGGVQATRSGATTASQGYVLNGAETWFQPDGQKQYDVEWKDGRKTGHETLWSFSGGKRWEWEHRADGLNVWTQY